MDDVKWTGGGEPSLDCAGCAKVERHHRRGEAGTLCLVHNFGPSCDPEFAVQYTAILGAEVGRLRAFRDSVTGTSDPWPLRDVLARLAAAAEHLRRDHDCDRHGYELDGEAVRRAREILALLEEL